MTEGPCPFIPSNQKNVEEGETIRFDVIINDVVQIVVEAAG